MEVAVADHEAAKLSSIRSAMRDLLLISATIRAFTSDDNKRDSLDLESLNCPGKRSAAPGHG